MPGHGNLGATPAEQPDAPPCLPRRLAAGFGVHRFWVPCRGPSPVRRALSLPPLAGHYHRTAGDAQRVTRRPWRPSVAQSHADRTANRLPARPHVRTSQRRHSARLATSSGVPGAIGRRIGGQPTAASPAAGRYRPAPSRLTSGAERPNNLNVCVEHDHAVLLPGDRDRGRPLDQPVPRLLQLTSAAAGTPCAHSWP
jgi:hypothetical protein